MEKHVAIVGAGLVGSGWAIVFARAGSHVKIFDPAGGEGVLSRIGEHLRAMETHGLVAEADSILARMALVPDLRSAVAGASYVQESVFERLDIKREVSTAIDAALEPGAVVGSSTSGLPASSFTENCRNRERFVVAHPVNPPHLVPVVEIVPAPWTSPETVSLTDELMRAVGQETVLVSREIPGFILNRLQGALLDEAWALFDEGYASAEDIDKTVKFGLGLRWSFMGPFETIDLNAPDGIDDYARRLGPMYAELAAGRRASGAWSEAAVERATAQRRSLLPKEKIEARRAWRDDMLMKLRAGSH